MWGISTVDSVGHGDHAGYIGKEGGDRHKANDGAYDDNDLMTLKSSLCYPHQRDRPLRFVGAKLVSSTTPLPIPPAMTTYRQSTV